MYDTRVAAQFNFKYQNDFGLEADFCQRKFFFYQKREFNPYTIQIKSLRPLEEW